MSTAAAVEAAEKKGNGIATGVGPNTQLSIVIVSWNTRSLLDNCLASVFADLETTVDLACEVWVVDNASDDGSAALVREKYPRVRLIENGENVGFARANNQALREAGGGYFLLLNSDTIVPAGALGKLVRVLDAYPYAAVCSPLLLNGDGTIQPCWACFPNLRSEMTGVLDRSQLPYSLDSLVGVTGDEPLAPFPVDWVGGACFLVRAQAAAEVGLLREDFFMYCEETEWCHRFRRAGWQTLLAPTVRVTHLGGQSSKAVPAVTRRRMYRSSVRLYRILYGTVWGMLLSLVATARFLFFSLKRRLNAPSALEAGG
jgi:hypothetical protein